MAFSSVFCCELLLGTCVLADVSVGGPEAMAMRSWRVSPEERAFQFKLMFIGLSVLLVLGAVRLWTWELPYALYGHTTTAYVIDVDDNHFNSTRCRLPYSRSEYQYWDEGAQQVRRGTYCKYDLPPPALGQTLAVTYLPDRENSSFVAEDDSPLELFWLTIPFGLVLVVLVGMLIFSGRQRA